MTGTAGVAQVGNPMTRTAPVRPTYTDIQLRLARDEDVPVRDLPGITEYDERVLATIGVYYVKELIFCSNKRIFGAFGGKGNPGTRRAIKRINAALCKHAFARRTGQRDYFVQVEHIQRVMAF